MLKGEKKPSPTPLPLVYRSNMLVYAWDLIPTCSDMTKPLMTVKRSAFHSTSKISQTQMSQRWGEDAALGYFVLKSFKYICKSDGIILSEY